jgi:peptide/nickel transport system substrate-binding protein
MEQEDWYRRRINTRPVSRRMLLQGAAAGLAGLGGAALLACGSRKPPAPAAKGSAGSGAGQPQPGGTFNTYVLANVGVLDPMAAQSSSSAIVQTNAYVPLFRFKTSTDPRVALNNEPENNLATSIESPDGLTWTVKLRNDIVFHNIPPVNGHAITSEDVKASFQRAFAVPNNGSLSLINMIDPNQIATPDATTVVFKLKNVFGPFHLTLAGSTSCIVPREALAGGFDPAKTVIGSGPVMWDSYTPDVALNLKKFPNWYEKGQPYVDAVHVAIIPDAAQQLAQFTAGHLDILRPAPNDLATAKQQNPRATVLGVPASRSWVFWGHMDRPNTPFTDINIRRALSMAIDRATLAKAVFGSDYSNNGVIPAALGTSALPIDQFGDAKQWYEYNPSAAKQIVAGNPAAKQLKRYMYPAAAFGAQFETLCQTVVSMLNAAGFQLQPVPLDYNKEFIGGGKGVLYGNYPDDALVSTTQGVHNDAATTLIYNYQSGNDHNLPKVSDPKIDAMLAQMNTLLDDSAHLKAVLDIQRYVAGQLYLIPLPSEYTYTALQPWVYNYQYGGAADGPNSLSRVWVKRS